MSNEWDIAVGDLLTRDERKARFGGSTLGGIQPSARTPNVFVYSDPAAGHRNGYVYDGWARGENVFLYTGEGQVGPQRMVKGNRAILDHKVAGRALRLFVADGRVAGSGTKQHKYIGEFAIDNDDPWREGEAPDVGGITRSVIVFRLLPVGNVLRRDADSSETDDIAAQAMSEIVDLEVGKAEDYSVPGTPEGIATRREHQFVERFRASLSSEGIDVKRLKLKPAGLLGHLFTDVYSPKTNELFEVKATNSREAVRTALGQILDYRQWADPTPTRNTVVICGRPPAGMVAVLNGVGVGLIYEDPETGLFIRCDPPTS